MTIACIGLFAGCSSRVERTVRAEELNRNRREIVLSASLRDSSVVTFTGAGAICRWVETPAGRLLCLDGETRRGERRIIAVADVVEAKVRTYSSDDPGAT